MKLMSVALSESDIPGSSLNGGSPSQLKNDELRFWLKCRDDPATGLRTKAEFLSGKRVRSMHPFDTITFEINT